MKKTKTVSVLLILVLALTWLCGAAAETAVTEDELLGSWIIVDVTVDDETEDTLAAAVKPYFDEGSEFLMVIDEDQFSLEILNADDPLKDIAPYTVEDGVISVGDMELEYIFVDGQLLLSSGSDLIVLERREDDNDPLDGTRWEMTAYSGQGPDACTMQFENGIVTVTYAFGEDVQTVESAYSYNGEILSMNDSEAEITLDDTVLTITDAGETMTLERIRDNGDLLDGTTWEMTDFTGSGFVSWTMTFSGGICSVTFLAEGMDASRTQEASYSFDGSTLSMNGTDADVTISDDIMTITDSGDTMTLQRK